MIVGKGKFICKECGCEYTSMLAEYQATSICVPILNSCPNCKKVNIEPVGNFRAMAYGEAHISCKDCGYKFVSMRFRFLGKTTFLIKSCPKCKSKNIEESDN